MPDQNPPTSPSQPVIPPTDPRPNFVAFEETQPVSSPAPTAPPPPPAGAPVTPPPPPPPATTSTVVSSGGGSKKKIFIIVGVVGVLLLILAGILFAMQQSSQQTTPTPSATPESATPTAYCSSIRAYDIEGNTINTAALADLEPGSIVRFAASGITTSGTFDKARFTINGIQRPEVTTKITGTDEFYDEYTIPEGVTSFNITAEVHMTETDTWY